jgi:Tol biopolymer transport system component
LISVDEKTITPLSLGKGSDKNGQISPDGKWLAYASNETGDWEVYVTTFPTPGGKWQVSRGGGTEPRWQGDDKEIFYVAPKGVLMSVSVDTSNGFSCGTPVALFPIRARAAVSSTDLFTYDVSADGKRILVNRYMKPASVPPLNIVLNSTSATQ